MQNWLTSLFGVGAGALNMLANNGLHNWKQALLSAAMAALGIAAKDFNKGNPAT